MAKKELTINAKDFNLDNIGTTFELLDLYPVFNQVDNLDENGLFKSPEALRNLYSELFKQYDKSKITFHCGSGVTACHSLLALDYAGFDIPNLYVGSWSEWSRNEVQL